MGGCLLCICYNKLLIIYKIKVGYNNAHMLIPLWYFWNELINLNYINFLVEYINNIIL